MNKGILMLLKSIGVEITPDHIAVIQKMITDAPVIVERLITTVNGFDARLARIEATLAIHSTEVN